MPTITDLGYNPKTKTKRNQSLSSMKRRIEYIYNKSTLIDSVLVNIDSVEVIYNEFIQTKKEFNKLDGNNFFHYVISFSDEDKIDEKDVMEIVYKFLEDKKFDGFQIFYGTHQDTDNLHCHILINSVNCINGKKWHLDNRKKDWLDMELKLNKIAKPYGCKIPEKIARLMEEKEVKNEYARKSKDEKSKYEEKMNMTGKSWKVKVKETIEYIVKNSVDEEDFIKNVKKAGYNIYKNKDDKYIINIKNINKKISLDKLDIKNMYERFEFNKRVSSTQDFQANIKKISKTYNNSIDELKEKSKSFDYEKDDNRKVYYKDLTSKLNKLLKENNNLKEDFEKEALSILKYALNSSKTLDEVLEMLNSFNLQAALEDNNILITFGEIKISSAYLNLNIDKELNNHISWKYELFLEIRNAKNKAISKDDFIAILNEKGINVNWSDTRKYITFTDKYKNKRRNDKLYPPDKFTKEELEKSFTQNAKKAEKEKEFKEYIKAKKYVNNQIYEVLKTSYSYNSFKKKLEEKDIHIKNDSENIEFEYKNETFKKDDYFKIYKEYIDNAINYNINGNLFALNLIFRVLDKRSSNNKQYTHHSNLNSKADIKNYISELKKGRNTIMKDLER